MIGTVDTGCAEQLYLDAQLGPRTLSAAAAALRGGQGAPERDPLGSESQLYHLLGCGLGQVTIPLWTSVSPLQHGRNNSSYVTGLQQRLS